jgi:hypothetical protein
MSRIKKALKTKLLQAIAPRREFSMLRTLRTWLAAAAIFGISITQLNAADLYVLQIGDGTDPLQTTTGIAAPIIINKFAVTGGSPVASVAMPTTTSGANSLFTTRGNSTTESFLHASTNGQYLVLGGIAATVGSTLPGAAGDFDRVVGRIDVNNFTTSGVDTSTVFGDGFRGNSFRSVASTNGTDFWMSGAGTGGGIRYTTLGSTTSTLVSNTTSNTRIVNIFNDSLGQPQLYTTSGSAAFLGVSTVGTGLPTTTGQTITLLPGTTADTSTDPMDFWFADANTLYKANGPNGTTGKGIGKYTFNSGANNWDLAYVLTAGTNTGGLTGVVTAGVTTLYATNYNGELVSIVDTGEFSVPTVLATAPTNTLFRGVALISGAVVPPGVAGDYNGNGKVDAADYVLWKNGGPLLNEVSGVTPGNVTPEDYDAWRARFGNNSGSGSGAAVPEPASAALLLIGVATLGWRRRSA